MRSVLGKSFYHVANFQGQHLPPIEMSELRSSQCTFLVVGYFCLISFTTWYGVWDMAECAFYELADVCIYFSDRMRFIFLRASRLPACRDISRIIGASQKSAFFVHCFGLANYCLANRQNGLGKLFLMMRLRGLISLFISQRSKLLQGRLLIVINAPIKYVERHPATTPSPSIPLPRGEREAKPLFLDGREAGERVFAKYSPCLVARSIVVKVF
jgi:hypothetical protein